MDSRRWEEIQTSFDELVELDASSRATRLATLESTDPELRRAVESLLAADSEASGRLAPLEAGLLSQSDTAIDPLGLAGRTISHYEVRELLGAGGMGAVYRADDTRLGRAVALKFLLPQYSLDAAARARFRREAQSAAALDHPNLCSIYEVGPTDDGQLFLAMALYTGETLKARLARDEPLPISQAFDIARQMAEGLKAAHASGIVHRDLKPANVMLLVDGTVKILDFGLAKARDQSLTETGARFGTVSYMAPEQVRGEKVDGRADLWALGVVLYEMLTGRKPFAGEEEVAIAHAILNDEPALPLARRDVSAAMEDVVFKLLQRDPAKRYNAAADLLADLTRGERVGAAVRHGVRRRLRHAKRTLFSRAGRMSVASVALLLIGGGGYAAVATRNGVADAVPPRTAIAVLPFRNLSADSSHAYLAHGLQDEILTQLYKAPTLKVIGRNSVKSYSGPNMPPLRQIASELGVGSVVDGSIHVAGNRVRVNVQLVDALNEAVLWVESYDRTLDDAYVLQSEIARQILATVGAALSGGARDDPGRVPTAKAQAYLLYLRARDKDRRVGNGTAFNIDTIINLYEQALALDPDFALAQAGLSIKHGDMYAMRHDMTPTRLARQRAAAEAALRLDPELPAAHTAMAKVHITGPSPDPKAYLREIQTALRLAPNDVDLWTAMARVYGREGDWDRSLAAFEKAVELDPRNVYVLDFGAILHERLGRFAEAVRWHNRNLDVAGKEGIMGQIFKAWVYATWQGQLDTLRAAMRGEPGQMMLGLGWMWQHSRFFLFERQADSLLKLHEWLRDETAHVGWSSLDSSYNELYPALAHELRGDSSAARAAFRSALVFVESALAKLPEDWQLHVVRGTALAGLGRRDDALREARWLRELAIRRNDHFLRPRLLVEESRILARASESEEAIRNLQALLSDDPPAITVHQLRLDPSWDRIREHARFKALLAKYAS